MRIFTIVLVSGLVTFASSAILNPGKGSGKGKSALDDVSQNIGLTEEEFEQKFHVVVSDPEERRREAEQLQKIEEEIQEQNNRFKNGESSFKEKLYPFSNLPEDDFQAEHEGAIVPEGDEERSLGGLLPPESERYDEESEKYFSSLVENRGSFPTSHNSSALGYISPVKDQKQCGSCVAFATAGQIEACMRKAGGSIVDLSEQKFVDCGFNWPVAKACDGAQIHAYAAWMVTNGLSSLPSEASYGYIANNQSCQNHPLLNTGAYVYDKAYTYGNQDNDTIKALILEHGAVVSALYVGPEFESYSEGIIDTCSNPSAQVNHAILLVGWGVHNGKQYWIGKNSWGTRWGEAGFFRINFGVCQVGTVAVVNKCQKNGQPVPTEPPPPASLTCDMRTLYGTITYERVTLNTRIGGILYNPTVKCVSGICQLLNPQPGDNACMKMCGVPDCTVFNG